MKILVGLGNPGDQYNQTRHNAGFWLLDALEKEYALTWKTFKGGLLGELILPNTTEKSLLFKPQKFMNLSGAALRQVVDFYKLGVEEISVIADDVYLAPGTARIRQAGGDGGHNGLKSVIEHLGSDQFWRVRIGVGVYEQHPEKRQHLPALDDYVLQPMPKHDEKLTRELIDKLLPNLIKWLESGEIVEQTIHL